MAAYRARAWAFSQMAFSLGRSFSSHLRTARHLAVVLVVKEGDGECECSEQERRVRRGGGKTWAKGM
jgi:hypothetical protein